VLCPRCKAGGPELPAPCGCGRARRVRVRLCTWRRDRGGRSACRVEEGGTGRTTIDRPGRGKPDRDDERGHQIIKKG
jgi:hypothetical protein